jgi:hypothetical protein
MPEYTRGQYRDNLVFVPLNTVFHYGWKTKDLANAIGISQADLVTQLGHMTPVQADAVANRIMVTGANSPKPARVVKRDRTAPISQAASTSTFLAYNKLSAATAAGWSLAGRARGVRLTANVDGRRSVTAIAELSNGLLYAFPLSRVDFDRVAPTLGLQDAASINTTLERSKLATGSRTKPGVCATDNNGGSFSTFFATDAADTLPAAGYDIISDEYIEFDAALP